MKSLLHTAPFFKKLLSIGKTLPQYTSTRTQLLVLQPTPFCNLDCDYCYLPDRTNRARMSLDTLESTLHWLNKSELLAQQLNIVWHAGEPMTLRPEEYHRYFERLESLHLPQLTLRHCMQSNATLVSRSWCEFIKQHKIHLGVSLDGPEAIHDAHRKHRSGKGSFAQATRGIKMLQAANIDFHVIAVISAKSLDKADAIFHFFRELGISRLGFNVEEEEAQHTASTLYRNANSTQVRTFFETIYALAKAYPEMKIREFERARVAIEHAPLNGEYGFGTSNDQNKAFSIVSVDWQGRISTYSPELIGVKNIQYGNFVFGSVGENDIASVRTHPHFVKLEHEIQTGIQKCATSCAYYAFCGGGAPANKYFENGTFASSETHYCRYSTQIPLDIVLSDLEETAANA